MNQRIVFTTHAVERYRTRVEPLLSYYDAAVRLDAIAATARLESRHTWSGQQIWRAAGPLYMVTKHDRGSHVCVTVLTEAMVEAQAWLAAEDELEAAERYAAARLVIERLQARVAKLEGDLAVALAAVPAVATPPAGADRSYQRALRLAQIENARARQAEKTRRHEVNMQAQDTRRLLCEAVSMLVGVAAGAPTAFIGPWVSALPEWLKREVQREASR